LGEDRIFIHRSDLIPYCSEFNRFHSLEESFYWPSCVVLPETTEEVAEIVRFAVKHRTPIVTRGGGSSFVEAVIPSEGAIVLSTSKMNQVIDIDPINLTVTAQPGVVLGEMDAILEPYGLILAQEQGSYKTANIGGAVSTNGYSRRNSRYGDIGDNVLSLEVVIGDGRIMRTGPKVCSNSSGYHLHKIFVAAEGTLGIITELTLQVMPKPEVEMAIAAEFNSWSKARDVTLKLFHSGINHSGGEGFASRLENGEWMYGILIGLEGNHEEVIAQKEIFESILIENDGILLSPEESWELWRVTRKKWCGILQPDTGGNSLTFALPLQHYDTVYKIVEEEIYPKYNLKPYETDYKYIVFGKRSLAGVEFIYDLNEVNHDQLKQAYNEIMQIVAKYGGSGPGCHGVGSLLRDFLVYEYDSVALDIMRSMKDLFDPYNILNPGKKLPDKNTPIQR